MSRGCPRRKRVKRRHGLVEGYREKVFGKQINLSRWGRNPKSKVQWRSKEVGYRDDKRERPWHTYVGSIVHHVLTNRKTFQMTLGDFRLEHRTNDERRVVSLTVSPPWVIYVKHLKIKFHYYYLSFFLTFLERIERECNCRIFWNHFNNFGPLIVNMLWESIRCLE